ncbi:DUF2165 domain-containing protein [Elongatibacter sediminis]|uniref:DUF2165 domain-containing protein n=1 Tax=Elongatibacter sediminis TaxID=3119006 RepID=A0AAW9RJW8_9GAMM
MAIRILKIVLVVFVGLQGGLYVAGNLANWEAAHGAIAYVLSMEGHEYYDAPIFPPITHPAWVTMTLLAIITGEFLIGALSFKGAWDLKRALKEPAEVFNSAKKYAILGAGMAMLVWFGGFIVIGGALFQMWQTEIGTASFEGAFIYAASSFLVLLFVNSADA